jgi:hypothetical protein
MMCCMGFVCDLVTLDRDSNRLQPPVPTLIQTGGYVSYYDLG